jgi:pimeloyl-ACP methyl ester carboxylesterase
VLAAALAACAPAVARPPSAALALGPCQATPGFTCLTVPVPLDRSGAAPGTIALSVERKGAAEGAAHSAVIALAGGPGQAALPLAASFAQATEPALAQRDLVVFDQRGTGRSDPLDCPAFEDLAALEGASVATIGMLVEACALQIGPGRGAFTTQESVQDIEAIRRALGYEKLVLYGTSYGTKVALEYAESFPQRVEALVLDSVVLTDQPSPFEIPTFQAIGPVLAELCSHHACAGITSNPLRDLARLTGRLRRHALRGPVYDGAGHRHTVTLDELGLLGILQGGDVNPALRALLPGAVRSALGHDPQPLLRLSLLAQGLIPNRPPTPPGGERETAEREEENDALFTDTICEETPFPWRRSAPPRTRNAEALAALRATPPSTFHPFDATSALDAGGVLACESWPDASAAPPAPGPLPNVPTLILSGAQDLRTPTANARSVAAEIPDAQLEVVPYTGHSVLGSDFSGCAQGAVDTFFAGGRVVPCAARNDTFAPTPIAPTRLASVRPPPGLQGKPGRTLTAVLDAIVDLNRQVIGATLEADQEPPSGSSFGGLRGGFARLTSSAATLRDFSFVPGVGLTGTFPIRDGQLQPSTIRVSGADASPGNVTFGGGRSVRGTLGGRHFDVSLATVRLSRAPAPGAWPARPVRFPLPALVAESPPTLVSP